MAENKGNSFTETKARLLTDSDFESPGFQETLRIYKQGCRDLQEYAGDSRLIVPDLIFQTVGKEFDMLNPKLDGLRYDDRIFIKLVKNLWVSNKSDSRVFHESVTSHCRGYICERDAPLGVSRLPIILTASPDNKLSNYSGLALEVFQNQIEPATTDRLEKRLKYYCEKGVENYDEAVSCCLDLCGIEERVIVNGIIRSWLFHAKFNGNGFDFGDVMNAGFRSLHPQDSYRALRQVQRIGVKRAIEYYFSDDFDTMKFLEGDF